MIPGPMLPSMARAASMIGVNELVVGFKMAAQRIGEKVDRSMGTTARSIATEAASLAPRDTGALAGSYRAEKVNRNWEVGSDLFYAPFVEFGTIHTSPRPHLFPAADKHSPGLYKAIEREVDKI